MKFTLLLGDGLVSFGRYCKLWNTKLISLYSIKERSISCFTIFSVYIENWLFQNIPSYIWYPILLKADTTLKSISFNSTIKSMDDFLLLEKFQIRHCFLLYPYIRCTLCPIINCIFSRACYLLKNHTIFKIPSYCVTTNALTFVPKV